ncbi:MAG: hypothetical protein JNM07_12080 [Phycisphaerae bacterium]|nr:hypothetical protein [Phycisphaerae bacterium]
MFIAIRYTRPLAPFALVAIVGSTAFAGTVTYFDGTFNNSNWALTSYGTGVVTGSQSGNSDGNPGFARDVLNDLIGNGTVQGFHERTASVYDPDVSRKITSIDFSIDAKWIGGTAGNGQQVAFALSQNGVDFKTSSVATGSSGNWNTISMTLTAADFTRIDGQAGSVDFTPDGGLITFGFVTANTGNNYNVQARYDNYNVVVHTIPLPSAAGMGLATTGCLALRRRRRS